MCGVAFIDLPMLTKIIWPLKVFPAYFTGKCDLWTFVGTFMDHQIIWFSESSLTIFAYVFTLWAHFTAEVRPTIVVINSHNGEHFEDFFFYYLFCLCFCFCFCSMSTSKTHAQVSVLIDRFGSTSLINTWILKYLGISDWPLWWLVTGDVIQLLSVNEKKKNETELDWVYEVVYFGNIYIKCQNWLQFSIPSDNICSIIVFSKHWTLCFHVFSKLFETESAFGYNLNNC